MVSSRIWQIYYTVVFRLACALSTCIELPLNGSLVAVWHRGRILLVRKSYQKGWAFPGGLCKRGESWRAAAVRETAEEAGICLEEQRLSFVDQVTGDLGAGNRTRLFETEIFEDVAIIVDGKEIVHGEFVPAPQALQRDLGSHVRSYLLERLQG